MQPALVNAALLGDSSTDWSRLAARLHMDNRLSAQTLEQVRRIGWLASSSATPTCTWAT
jgi:hypothetical protein